MKARALEHYSDREQDPRHLAFALRTLFQRFLSHFLDCLELVSTVFALIYISRHCISPQHMQGLSAELNYITNCARDTKPNPLYAPIP